MKIAVTGAFGFVGHHLVNSLLKENYSVTVVSHTNKDISRFESSVILKSAAVDDIDSLSEAFRGIDIIFHLVGIIAETRSKTFDKTVTLGTKNIVQAADKNKVKKIIYLSALGTGKNAKSKYHQSKFKAEQFVINSNLQYVIFRPSIIYGKGDGFVSMLTQMMKFSPFLPVIGNGRYQMQPLYVDDLTAIMANAVTLESAENKIFEIGGPQKLEYLEILCILKSVVKKKRMNFFLPKWLMIFTASVLEKIIKPAPITRDQILMMESGNTCDITEMKNLFSIEPISFENGLKKYMR